MRADSRKVVFRYRPPGFVAGSLISIGSLLALGGWLVAGLRGRRSGIPPKPPGA